MNDMDLELSACTDCVFYAEYAEVPEHVSDPDAWIAAFKSRWVGWHLIIGDYDGFSWRSCGVCGSTLGGDRHTVIASPIMVQAYAVGSNLPGCLPDGDGELHAYADFATARDALRYGMDAATTTAEAVDYDAAIDWVEQWSEPQMVVVRGREWWIERHACQVTDVHA